MPRKTVPPSTRTTYKVDVNFYQTTYKGFLWWGTQTFGYMYFSHTWDTYQVFGKHRRKSLLCMGKWGGKERHSSRLWKLCVGPFFSIRNLVVMGNWQDTQLEIHICSFCSSSVWQWDQVLYKMCVDDGRLLKTFLKRKGIDIFLLPLHVGLKFKREGGNSRSHIRSWGIAKKAGGHILTAVKQKLKESGAEVTAGLPHHPCTAQLLTSFMWKTLNLYLMATYDIFPFPEIQM